MAGRTGLSSASARTGDRRHDRRRVAARRLARLRRVRWRRVAALVVAALLVAAVFGVTTASAVQSLGPHEARYAVTTDDLVILDLGPLGTVEIPSPLPLTLGVRITVQEIPAAVTAVDPASTVQVLGQDLQSYVQFFTGPQAALEDAAWALAADAVERTLLAFVALLVAGGVLAALIGPARRRELAARASGHRSRAVRGTAIALAVLITCVNSVDQVARQGDGRRTSAVFAGTPLDGARITGRLAGVIDTYGSMVVDAYRENEAFYDRANAAVAAAWDQRALALAVTEGDDRGPVPAAGSVPAEDAGSTAQAPTGDAASGGPLDSGSDDPTGGAAGDEGAADSPGAGDVAGDDVARDVADEDMARDDAAGDDAAGDDAAASSTPAPTPGRAREPVEPVDPVVMLLVSDLHCNVGMARIIRTVAERAGADVVLNAGDTTVNGTSVEQYCVTSFSQAVPPGVDRVVADGNHDSLETEEQERAAGWTVLDGEVVTVDGVRILGDRDPNRTQIGGGTAPVSTESPAEAGARLADTACEAGDVDVLLIHTPRVGDEAMRTGCVAVQLSGHQHRRSGPLPVGRGIRYVSSTTAGATSGGATVGPLNGIAELTVLRFDPDSRRMMDLQVVQVMPDASAVVGPREPFPTPGTVTAPGDGDATTGPDGPAPSPTEPPATGSGPPRTSTRGAEATQPPAAMR